MKMERPTNYEPLTEDMIAVIHEPFMSIQRSEMLPIDVARGVGVIDASTKCVWLKDGRRLTLSGGGFIASLSCEVDPLSDPAKR